MIATVAVFFVLLWIAVIVLGIAPDMAFILSLVTLVLVGVGVMFTTSTFRRENDDR